MFNSVCFHSKSQHPRIAASLFGSCVRHNTQPLPGWFGCGGRSWEWLRLLLTAAIYNSASNLCLESRQASRPSTLCIWTGPASAVCVCVWFCTSTVLTGTSVKAEDGESGRRLQTSAVWFKLIHGSGSVIRWGYIWFHFIRCFFVGRSFANE